MTTLFKTVTAMALAFSAAAYAGLPVTPAKDQKILLHSSNRRLARNKKLVYDFTRVVLTGLRLDQTQRFLRDDYIQHNPNVATGLDGFLAAFGKLGNPKPIPDEVPGLVSITAEGDIVTMSFVNQQDDPHNPGTKYTTTWFDMFRVQDGKIAEHWDCDIK